MRNEDWWLVVRGVAFYIVLVCGGILIGMILASCTGYFAPNGAGAYHRTQAARDSARVADSLENWRADSIYKARRDTT